MNPPPTIGLDLGTGAVKGVLWDGDRILAEDFFDVAFLRDGGRVEVDPLPYRDEVFALLRRLADRADGEIGAISMCAASGNTLAVDAEGAPLCRIVSWLDSRTVDPPDDEVHEIVGWPWVGGFSQAHLCLLRRERPELFRPETFFCMNNDWIQFQLCGVRFLDYSSATPFYLQDQRTFRYCKKYLERVGVSEAQLSPLVSTGRVMGTLRESVAAGNLTTSTRLVSGSFDHPAAARACQITRPGDLLISCGTSWVGFFPVMERRIRPGTLFDPYLSPEGGPWGELVSLTGIGRELEAYIVNRYSTGPDRYQKFNEDAATGGPAANVMRETVRKFKDLLPEKQAEGKAILVGGPASSPSWRRIINRELKRDTAPSPFGKYAGAVGAAMIARQAMEL